MRAGWKLASIFIFAGHTLPGGWQTLSCAVQVSVLILTQRFPVIVSDEINLTFLNMRFSELVRRAMNSVLCVNRFSCSYVVNFVFPVQIILLIFIFEKKVLCSCIFMSRIRLFV